MGCGRAVQQALSLKNDCWRCTDGSIEPASLLLLLKHRCQGGTVTKPLSPGHASLQVMHCALCVLTCFGLSYLASFRT